jgi:hypothetical protein
MNTIKYIFKRIKVKPIPAIFGVLGILISPLIAKSLDSFVGWLAKAPDANISTLLIFVFILFILLLVNLFYLIPFAKDLLNPFDMYPYEEEISTCKDKNGNRYCPTGITDNKKHPVRKENGVWICSNKNCKNSIPPMTGHQW